MRCVARLLVFVLFMLFFAPLRLVVACFVVIDSLLVCFLVMLFSLFGFVVFLFSVVLVFCALFVCVVVAFALISCVWCCLRCWAFGLVNVVLVFFDLTLFLHPVGGVLFFVCCALFLFFVFCVCGVFICWFRAGFLRGRCCVWLLFLLLCVSFGVLRVFGVALVGLGCSCCWRCSYCWYLCCCGCWWLCCRV